MTHSTSSLPPKVAGHVLQLILAGLVVTVAAAAQADPRTASQGAPPRTEVFVAAGVSLKGGDRPTLTPAGNKLLLSRVRDFGRVYRTYQPAVGLSGVGQIVAANRLSHAPHSAIIFSGNDHLIERNEIFDVLRETGDCGAIYCGRDWTMHGNRIHQNHIHSLRGTEGRSQNAIYLDDMASGISVTQNRISRCHWGMLIGGGRDLDISGNVFWDCDLGIRFDARGVGWMAKHIADPETSTLHRRLAAMPVERPPWSMRFPSLQTYLTDRFGRPVGSRVVGNLFIDTPFGSVVDREAVQVGGNVERPGTVEWTAPGEEPSAGRRQEELISRRIPRDSIGPGILVLAEHGFSEWTIVVPDAARAVEREAAERLRDFVARMSGARLPIVSEADAPAARRILIGATRAAEAAGVEVADLGEDGFRIEADGADRFFIVGGSGHGVDYGVTEILERLGCRFWAPAALVVPESSALRLPAPYYVTEVPRVWFRHVNYGPALDPEYRRWHRLDRIQEEVGRLWAPRWVHSMFHHVPPERYFEEHPEYYALIGGERQPTQLCLSNPDVLRITIESIRQMLAEHPDVRYISISQEDNYAHCQCAEARAINEREGSAMGETLQFVNAVAEAFPQRIISTLAYQYTRKPPKHLRPRKNVSIMLCTIEEDRSRPIAESKGSTFPADFAGWSAICDDIFLWDYEVQFASPVSPFPNLRILQPNVTWFVENGVRHLFLQGNGLHTEMAELRCYLLAKLSWNPDIDVAAITAEFLEGFYGAAALFLGRYLDLIHDEMEASKQPLLIYGHPAQAMDTWLRPEVIDAAKVLFAQAEQAVAAEPVFLQRVRFARLPLIYAELEIAKRHGAGARGIYHRIDRAGHGPLARWGVRPQIRQLLQTFLQGCEEAGIRRLREQNLTPEEYRTAWERLFDVSRLRQPAFGKAVIADPPPHPKYGGGDLARLTDGLPGGDRYTENWIGWEGCDAVVTLDLGEPRPLRELSFSALQDPKSWIWLPRKIDVAVSADGETWHPAATLTPDLPERESLVHTFTADLPELPIRYLRLTLDATETCPPWHHGAPGPSWFFLDELEVR